MDWNALRDTLSEGDIPGAMRQVGLDPAFPFDIAQFIDLLFEHGYRRFAKHVLDYLKDRLETPEYKVIYYSNLGFYEHLVEHQKFTPLLYGCLAIGIGLASESPEALYYAYSSSVLYLELEMVSELFQDMIKFADILDYWQNPEDRVRFIVGSAMTLFEIMKELRESRQKQKVKKIISTALKGALEIAKNSGDKELVAWCRLHTGILHAETGAKAAAYEQLTKAVKYYLENDEEEKLLHKALYHLGSIVYEYSKFQQYYLKEAEQYLTEAEKIIESYLDNGNNEDTEWLLNLAKVRKMLADVYKEMGKQEEAELYRKKLRGA